jgi:hypothetical protein
MTVLVLVILFMFVTLMRFLFFDMRLRKHVVGIAKVIVDALQKTSVQIERASEIDYVGFRCRNNALVFMTAMSTMLIFVVLVLVVLILVMLILVMLFLVVLVLVVLILVMLFLVVSSMSAVSFLVKRNAVQALIL